MLFRYLFMGNGFQTLAENFMMGESTVRKIVNTVTRVMWEVLQPKYMPKCTEEVWVKIADKFYSQWQIPNCVGSIDGKHIRIRKPGESGTKFHNYKGYFSINLMAVVTADYKFAVVDVGGFGSSSDGGILKASSFGKKLEAGKLDLPPDDCLPGGEVKVPFCFIGDAAFPSKKNILRPYPGKDHKMREDLRIYNYRHSRARMTVECAFGILAARFQLYQRKIQSTVMNVEWLVLATTVLHNFLTKPVHRQLLEWPENEQLRLPFGSMDANRARGTADALEVRDHFKAYFNGYGAVEWQRVSAGLLPLPSTENTENSEN